MEYPTGPMSRPESQTSIDGIRRVLREELAEAGLVPPERIELADRWEGGEVLLRPGREGLQEKAISMESFFKKIVMVRERLRVLEQKINAHPKLEEAEKIELQGYITRAYGSLTTFNFLFDNRMDWFTGAKGEK